MVVVSRVKPHWQHGGRDEYWKIYNHNTRSNAEMLNILRKRKYNVSNSSKKAELVKSMERLQRGLLRYESYLVSELRDFCLQRQLSGAKWKKTKKDQLVAALEAADEAQEFRHLVDLPAELRVLIYTFYFKSLPKLDEPIQPPILKASSLIRQEASPLFYLTCVFMLSDYPATYRRTSSKELQTKGRFWNHLSGENLEGIRRLEIQYGDDTRRYWSFDSLKWDDRGIKISELDGPEVEGPGSRGQRLVGYLKDVGARAEGSRLTKTDIVDLERLMRQVP